MPLDLIDRLFTPSEAEDMPLGRLPPGAAARAICRFLDPEGGLPQGARVGARGPPRRHGASGLGGRIELFPSKAGRNRGGGRLALSAFGSPDLHVRPRSAGRGRELASPRAAPARVVSAHWWHGVSSGSVGRQFAPIALQFLQPPSWSNCGAPGQGQNRPSAGPRPDRGRPWKL